MIKAEMTDRDSFCLRQTSNPKVENCTEITEKGFILCLKWKRAGEEEGYAHPPGMGGCAEAGGGEELLLHQRRTTNRQTIV